MPQIQIGQTVNFTVGQFNSISRNQSQQDRGTWFYGIKGNFELGDKLQGTAHLIWAMLPVWPGAGGVLQITRTGPTDFEATGEGGGQPPRLEEWNAASRGYDVVAAAAMGDDFPHRLDEEGPELDIPGHPVTATTGATTPQPKPAVTNNGAYDLDEFFALAEACVEQASQVLERKAEQGWTITTENMVGLSQTLFNNSSKMGLKVVKAEEPPAAVTEAPRDETSPPPNNNPPASVQEAADMVDNLFNT